MNCSGSVMKVLMIVMMFQDEITSGRKSNLCWRCLYYVTTNDYSNDTSSRASQPPSPASQGFYFILDDGSEQIAKLASSFHQIWSLNLTASPIIPVYGVGWPGAGGLDCDVTRYGSLSPRHCGKLRGFSWTFPTTADWSAQDSPKIFHSL